MHYKLPNINKMTTVEAIHWYKKEIAVVFSSKNRIAGTYTDEYKDALLSWKQNLNKKSSVERNRK